MLWPDVRALPLWSMLGPSPHAVPKGPYSSGYPKVSPPSSIASQSRTYPQVPKRTQHVFPSLLPCASQVVRWLRWGHLLWKILGAQAQHQEGSFSQAGGGVALDRDKLGVSLRPIPVAQLQGSDSLSPPHPLRPHLGVEEGLHSYEVHQPLLNQAQKETYVSVPHAGLNPQEVIDDGTVTLGPGEELLNIWKDWGMGGARLSQIQYLLGASPLFPSSSKCPILWRHQARLQDGEGLAQAQPAKQWAGVAVYLARGSKCRRQGKSQRKT